MLPFYFVWTYLHPTNLLRHKMVYGDTANNAVLYMNDAIIKWASSTGYGGVSFCFIIAAGDSFYDGFANIAQFAPFKNA